MAAPYVFIAFLASLFTSVHAVTAFIAPPAQGQDVLLASQFTISWITDWGSGTPITLTVWQETSPSWSSETLVNNQIVSNSTYVWNSQTLGNLPLSDGFHFELARGMQTPNGPDLINSGAVFLKESLPSTPSAAASTTAGIRTGALATSASTTSDTSSQIVTTSSTIASTSASTTPSQSSTASSQEPENSTGGSGTNVGAIVAASVCGTLAAIFLAILTFFFFKRDRGGNRLLFAGVAYFKRGVSQRPTPADPEERAYHCVPYHSPQEMPPDHALYELPE
ncbi:MAG: hypothetical protein M1822_004458 [Bathelium mastoideum]|nr:MAG: hypothetical protein M1822_004458 [Bathelium mastoideum]